MIKIPYYYHAAPLLVIATSSTYAAVEVAATNTAIFDLVNVDLATILVHTATHTRNQQLSH